MKYSILYCLRCTKAKLYPLESLVTYMDKVDLDPFEINRIWIFRGEMIEFFFEENRIARIIAKRGAFSSEG